MIEPRNSLSQPDFSNTQNAFNGKSSCRLRFTRLLFISFQSEWLMKTAQRCTDLAINWIPGSKKIIETTIFSHFCGGSNLQRCSNAADQLESNNVNVILDYAVEGGGDSTQIKQTMDNLKEAIAFASSKKNIPYVVIKITSLIDKEILEKLNHNKNLAPADLETLHNLRQHLQDICNEARNKNIGIMIDAEESWYQDMIDSLAMELITIFNKRTPIVFTTVQMYRTDRLAYLKKLISHCKETRLKLGVKLVRGAYMEKEREYAKQRGIAPIVFSTKEESDQAFDQAAEICCKNIETISLVLGTHNAHSCLLVSKWIQNHPQPEETRKKVVFAQLFGMSDNLTNNLSASGFLAAKYLPYGPVSKVLPYLMRRAEENSSISGQSGRELQLISTELARRSRASS